MKKIYKFIVLVLLFGALSSITIKAESNNNADGDIRSYIYDSNNKVINTSSTYSFKTDIVIQESYSKIESILYPHDEPNVEKGYRTSKITSVHFANEKYYILDGGLGAIHIYDINSTYINTILKFKVGIDSNGDDIYSDLYNAKGIYVYDDLIYIAHGEMSRIVILHENGNLYNIITKPNHLAIEDLNFNPYNIAVSYTGRIYVVGENIYYGVLELEKDGTFNRFIGVNPVNLSIWQRFLRTVMSAEQRDYASIVLPQQFRGIDIDDEGFIYTTSYTTTNPIKKINNKGENVLVANPYVGDRYDKSMKADFDSVSVNNHGIYSVLDKNSGRIFTYNSDGDLLYILGGFERQDGKFLRPTDICWSQNDELIVVDDARSSITILEPTEFGKKINEASRYHYKGLYEEAKEIWENIIKYDSNYYLAYVGIGKIYLYSGQYYEAMRYFKLGDNKKYYSEAYSLWRSEWLRSNILYILIPGILVITGFLTSKFYRNRKNGREENDDE